MGVDPNSVGMRGTFVAFGFAYLGAIAAYLARRPGSSTALGIVAVASLWYLPVGTLFSVLQIVGLWLESRSPRASYPPKRR